MQIKGQEPFTVPTTAFGISASNQGYTLEYSIDGKTWTSYTDATPANENLIVNGFPKGIQFRLNGNTDSVYLQY